jgi:sigma-B regulation protein RsbU (phosphoserine phosphatase)
VVGQDVPETPETAVLHSAAAPQSPPSSDGQTRHREGEQGSLLALPLVVRNEVVGMMGVDYAASVRRFGERWMSILSGIANQAALAVESSRLLEEAAEQVRMKQELEVARRIQSSFLPDRYPDIPGWELAALWRAAREVGGDFYDFFPIQGGSVQSTAEEGAMGVVIADVCGKGVPAALFMALSRTLVRTMAISGRSPSHAIAQANDLILADARSGLFVTLFYVILQPNSGDISYVNAGHMPPILIRSADGSAEELRTRGMAMAVLPGIEFEQKTSRLELGDMLILYTDGVVEASTVEGAMFGRQRLMETVQAHRALSPAEMVRVIDETLTEFVGEAPQFDDLTLVIARRTP